MAGGGLALGGVGRFHVGLPVPAPILISIISGGPARSFGVFAAINVTVLLIHLVFMLRPGKDIHFVTAPLAFSLVLVWSTRLPPAYVVLPFFWYGLFPASQSFPPLYSARSALIVLFIIVVRLAYRVSCCFAKAACSPRSSSRLVVLGLHMFLGGPRPVLCG